MANSYVQYTGTGSQKAFSVPFDYIEQSHVKVYVNSVLVVGYSWTNSSQITFTTAPASGASVLIRRITPTAALVDFTAKSRWQTTDLNLANKQALYVAEEAEEQVSTWLTGTGVPSNSIGNEGDFYIATNTGNWYRKGPSTWTLLRSIIGPQGAVGPQGPQGEQGPQGAVGAAGNDGTSVRILGTVASVGDLPVGATTGDAYLVGGNLYVWSGSSWTNVGNIVGPQGAQGATGPQGVQGAQGPQGDVGPTGSVGDTGPQGPQGTQGAVGPQGSVWLNSAGAPSSGVGNVGDIYLNTTNGDYYLKTGSSTWTLQGNITGPQGPQGAQGAAGPQGSVGPQGVDGPQGAAGATGTAGADGGVKYSFSTTTTDVDPGLGKLRFNNATPASITQLYVDNVDADGNTVTGWLDTFDDSTTSANRGYIYIRQQGSTKIAVFQVNGAVVDGSGYRKVPVAYVTGDILDDVSNIYVLFTRTGNQGAAGSGSGDMAMSTYDTDADGKVDAAEVADAAPWSGITGKPSTFTPSTHTHATSDVTGLDTALAGKQPLDGDLTAIAALAGTSGLLRKTAADTWSLDTSSYTVSGHTHATSDVTGLDTALAGKQGLNSNLTSISALADPNATRMVYWNDSTNQWTWLTLGTNLSISSDTLNASTGATWGAITGTLSSQTDLQAALDDKQTVDSLLDVTASAGTTTLTASSPRYIRVTGSTTHTIALPDVSTLPLGETFTVHNLATGQVTVQTSTGATVAAPLQNSSFDFRSVSTSVNTAAGWQSKLDGSTSLTGSGNLVGGFRPTIQQLQLTSSTSFTAGTNAQGQGVLSESVTVITTAANNPSGVTLPTAGGFGTSASRIVTIINRGANDVNVYPPSGANIDGLGANTPLLLDRNGMVTLYAASTTQWYSSKSNIGDLKFIGGVASVSVDNNFSASQTISTTGAASFSLSGTSGSSRVVTVATGGSTRWAFGATNTAETGSGAGSNFAISRYNDSGVFVDQPVLINRATGAISLTGSTTVNGSVLVNDAASVLGYNSGNGTGGTVTQATSRTTGVTLNKPNGAITMFSAAGSTTAATFTVTNSIVTANDIVVIATKSSTNNYDMCVTKVSAGSFQITFRTFTGTATDAPVIQFAVIKGSTN